MIAGEESRERQAAIQAGCVHPGGTFVPFGADEIEGGIVARFARQVLRHPDRIAVKAPGQRLTYAELDRAANRIARAILARAAGPQDAVALLLPKNASLVVAMIGVLKAGHVCMPLAPDLPAARLAAVLEEADARVVLTTREHFATARAAAGPRSVLDVDALDAAAEVSDPGVSVPDDAVALIFFTSGSTGSPKGIAESHRNLLHQIMLETNTYGICPEDRLSFLASTGRDVLRAVLNGAAVYPMEVAQESAPAVASWLKHEGITFLNLVVSAFRHLVDGIAGDERFPDLRLIKLIGESVTRRDVESYQARFSDRCVLVNSYGPNETGHLAHFLVDKATRLAGVHVPVGYAAEGKEILVLGNDGREVGPDQVGEIAARSRYLSPGYWRRPDLTLAAFSPTAPDTPERVYRTGDLGVMRADGCVTHLGRKDLQIKIRGHRVELAEVELALLEQAVVKEAVVMAREDGPGPARLVAYVVPAGGVVPTASQLRGALAARLPEYMIPSAFVLLDALPLVGIGKVDRRALPPPTRGRPELAAPYAAPRTPVEAGLSRLWAESLELEHVGIHDEFLDLGGNSLVALRIVSRLSEAFRIEAPPKEFLAASTVAEMAVLVLEHQARAIRSDDLARVLARLETPPGRSAGT